MGVIIAQNFPVAGRIYPLARAEIIIGRGRQADVPLDDNSVSRAHAVIKRTKQGYVISDSGSRNGTKVNGVAVVRRHLYDGDKLFFGDVSFEFHEVEEKEQSANVPCPPLIPPVSDRHKSLNLDMTRTCVAAAGDVFSGDESGAILLHAWNFTARFGGGAMGPADVLRSIIDDLAGLSGVRRAALYLPQSEWVPQEFWAYVGGNIQESHGSTEVLKRHLSNAMQTGRAFGLQSGKRNYDLDGGALDTVYLPIAAGDAVLGCLYLEGESNLSFSSLQVAQSAVKAIGLGLNIIRSGLAQTASVFTSALAGNGGIIGKSRAIQQSIKLALKVAASDTNVLIRGETGVGKELVARLIVEESARKSRSFITMHCSAVDETLLGSMLFGHERGAFTGAVGMKKGVFEEADGGTIFLDEIGELSLGMQVKLLRVLQEGEFMRLGGTKQIKVNTRVIAATNRDLEADIASGKFREDLYYRLKVIQIRLPPLRERREDIPELARYFLAEFTASSAARPAVISPVAAAALEKYPWPGNIRELRNVIERCVVLAEGPMITPDDLPSEIALAGNVPIYSEVDSTKKQTKLCEVELQHIKRILSECEGNKRLAANRLGMSRSTLYEKLKH